ncbi:MAG: M20/M25/M40 family metallo-hydrolase [Saprospiraceae bacterium]
MIDNLIELMKIDSTSGKERELAFYIRDSFNTDYNSIEMHDNEDNTFNVLIKWGNPKMLFCTHLDTVPPYIAPTIEGELIKGRGSCDAKGQIAAMYQTCLELEKEGQNNFGLLLLAGEEIGSRGAKKANLMETDCQYMVIGEPTENKLIRAAKGTKLFEIEILGKNAHSGYPERGDNAVETMRIFLNNLASIDFPIDPVLGTTTYNIGLLKSNNAVNVISASVKFKLYFRTTFSTDKLVIEKILNQANDKIKIKHISGDSPINFETFDFKNTEVVSYGSDAPSLTKFGKKVLYGPGSIFDAHTDNEKISLAELNQAVKTLKEIYFNIKKELK